MNGEGLNIKFSIINIKLIELHVYNTQQALGNGPNVWLGGMIMFKGL